MAARAKAKRQAVRKNRVSFGEKRLEGLVGYLGNSAAQDVDRLVYQRVRLGIMSALAVNRSIS